MNGSRSENGNGNGNSIKLDIDRVVSGNCGEKRRGQDMNGSKTERDETERNRTMI